jgi:ubiquinone/menaquinone biosynthesis C-methylase UbiE
MNDYDRIAGIYDVLGRLVFGKALVQSQVELLPFIKPESNVLIVGGGTGWILEKLTDLHPQGLHITYLEASLQMIKISKRRDVKQNKVVFVHSALEQFIADQPYDFIFTGFFFDNFSKEKLPSIFTALDALLKSGGQWLFIDFHYKKGEGKWWQGWLLKTMYLFFKVACKLEGKELASMDTFFKEAGYREEYVRFYYKGFIKGVVYGKQ